MQNALEIIKNEKINVVCLFHDDDGATRAAYLCTKDGTELDLDSSFFSKYDLEEIWNVKWTSTGCLSGIYDYKITEKISGQVVFSQS